MFLLGDRLIVSASDLRLASECELAVLRELDICLGRVDQGVVEDDPMSERLSELGDLHEQAQLRELRARHPGEAAVVELPRPAYSLDGLEAAMRHTLDALSPDSGVEVLCQATVFDGEFVGHVDFLERTDAGWLVSDTKLARHATVPALLQIGAYAAVLDAAGVPLAPDARLSLGSGADEDFAVAELMAVYAVRRARLDTILRVHRDQPLPARWDSPEITACGRCTVCEVEAEAALDLVLVAGMRMPTRRRLIDAGVRTVADLAARVEPVPDVRERTLERLRQQARLQLAFDAHPEAGVISEVVDPRELHRLPRPSDGDLFFDFEGDPLWAERGSSVWGLEYLFGMVEVDGAEPSYRAFWAHDRRDEKAALIAFVEFVEARRGAWPGMHVYHYAPYEVTALKRLAARYATCEDVIDQWLRDALFVDLYAVVRASLRVSQRSYSLKKLEPLYMDARSGEVTAAADSIVAYHRFMALRDVGRLDDARRELDEIADYNRDDCVSTLRLRNWLLTQVEGTEAVAPAEPAGPEPQTVSAERQALIDLEALLRSRIDQVKAADRTPEQQAVAMAASSVLFHAREDKPKWQAHFERLRAPVREWRGEEGVFVVSEAELVDAWHLETPRQRRPRRLLRLVGEPLRDIPLTTGSVVHAVYDLPSPEGVEAKPGHAHAESSAQVAIVSTEETVGPDGRLRQTLMVLEAAPPQGGEHTAYPIALVPSDHVRTGSIDAALAELGREVLATLPDLPVRAGTDLLLRRAPRLRSGDQLPGVGDGPLRHVAAITEALTAMDDSYVAVQGPPGTGKTWVGARVIAALVEQGWRIGVTSQSHAAIENLLTAVVAAGVPADRVGKEPRATDAPTWTTLDKADHLASFMAGQESGCVIGGTAWDLTNTARVQRGQLDLVVVDEAGQFSLAKTLAVAMAGSRLLLLGDPRQLPQVSTGTHPDPVDESALGWILGEEPVVPTSHGYFLETTWRMHPALTSVVSDLAYAGELRSESSVTSARVIEGVEPGLHAVPVDHRDNSTWSPEEVGVVVDLAASLMGGAFTPGAGATARPLEQRDVVVITPYNAQVSALRTALAGAGLADVPVGTVDKFQGQEAAVAIVSLAASGSGGSGVSRGLDFLLSRNRLNVAISRGQVAAYLVHGAGLRQIAPHSAAELMALGAFLRLLEGPSDEPAGSGAASGTAQRWAPLA